MSDRHGVVYNYSVEQLKTSSPDLADIITEEGGLYQVASYIDWKRGKEAIKLDGDYTIEDLLMLALYMIAASKLK